MLGKDRLGDGVRKFGVEEEIRLYIHRDYRTCWFVSSLKISELISLDPGPLASSLWLDEDLESRIYLDAIVTVIDSKYFARVCKPARNRLLTKHLEP